ncbi:MAG: alpha/beta hydrolase, partial [bacterium]
LYKFDEFSKDLHQILESEGLGSVIIAGYSLGGIVALDFAINYPSLVTDLILIGSGYIGPMKQWRVGYLLPVAQCFLSFCALALFWQRKKEYYYFNQDEDLTYWRATFLGFVTMPISIDFWLMREIISINYKKYLDKLSANTLIIRSKVDPFVSAEEVKTMLEKIPKCSLVMSRQESHFMSTEIQVETASFIINFLEKNENSNL